MDCFAVATWESQMITHRLKDALMALLVWADEARACNAGAVDDRGDRQTIRYAQTLREHLLLEIRNVGVIVSVRGMSGGDSLVRKPQDNSISEMLRRTGGSSENEGLCCAIRARPVGSFVRHVIAV
jgi:DNA-binding IscR family transcriptional regulator